MTELGEMEEDNRRWRQCDHTHTHTHTHSGTLPVCFSGKLWELQQTRRQTQSIAQKMEVVFSQLDFPPHSLRPNTNWTHFELVYLQLLGTRCSRFPRSSSSGVNRENTHRKHKLDTSLRREQDRGLCPPLRRRQQRYSGVVTCVWAVKRRGFSLLQSAGALYIQAAAVPMLSVRLLRTASADWSLLPQHSALL